MLRSAEQRGETGVRVEARPAEPVDRALARHQRCAFAVADQRIVLDAAFAGVRHYRSSKTLSLSESRIGEFYHDLDVVWPTFERFAEAIERHAPRDQAREPGAVGAGERFGSHLIVTKVGIHGAEHRAVVKH